MRCINHARALVLCIVLMSASILTTPRIASADEGLTLHLTPGYNVAVPGVVPGPPPAPDIPPGAVDVTVPLYPNAVPTTETEAMPALTTLRSPYLKSAFAIYLAPTDPATAEAWYRQAFMTAGFHVEASGGSNDSRAGASSILLEFAGEAGTPDVELSLAADQHGQTIVYYLAQVVTVPPRDPVTILSDVTRIDVTYFLPLSGTPARSQASVTRQVTDPAQIRALTAAFDELPRDQGVLRSCVLDNGTRAALVFTTSDGRSLSATEGPACGRVSVSGYATLDDNGRLWSAINAAMAPYLLAPAPSATPIPTATATPTARPVHRQPVYRMLRSQLVRVRPDGASRVVGLVRFRDVVTLKGHPYHGWQYIITVRHMHGWVLARNIYRA